MKKWFESMFGKSGQTNGKKTPKSPKTSAPKAHKIQPKTKSKTVDSKSSKIGNQSNDRKLNIRKTRSLESLFNANKPQVISHFGSRLTSLNGGPPGQSIFDVSAYLIHCPKHQKMAVSVEEKNKYIWLPFVALPSQRTWDEGTLDGAYIVLSGGDPNVYLSIREKEVISHVKHIQLFRLQLPQTQRFNICLINHIELNPNASDFKCCSNTKRLQWLPLEDICEKKVKNMFGPEVVECAKSISGSVIKCIEEHSLDDAFMYVPRDPPRNVEEKMLKSTNFTQKDVERIYTDFIEHCFPAASMTQTSFNDYMSKYGFEKMDRKLELLFKAFNYKKKECLSFHEFLLGLASIDPNASNGPTRVKFVFKYFDVDSDGHLNDKEFTSLVREMFPNDSSSQITQKVKDYKNMIGVKDKGIHFDDFAKAVGALKFRGTRNLCRSNQPILAQISRSMASRTIRKTIGKSSLGSIMTDRKYKGVCLSCKEKKYEFAIHKIRINAEGMSCDPKPVPELTEMDTQSNENLETVEKKSSNDGQTSVKSSPNSSGISGYTNNRFSTEIVWNPKSVANHLIELIREFNLKKGSHNDNKGVMDGSDERAPFVHKLKELCSEVEKIVVQEERCVKVNSPAFVIGDIHGNIEDLFTMERVLWKSIPIVSANYVFLGDYVDRGKWGLECALYLLCFKLLAPNKITLLRGNHEVRELQRNYSYKNECLHKYGDTLGTEVFEATNRVFDRLPFCAVIDDAIYCAHGGIPASTRQIEKINEVQVELKSPESESAIAQEILWSDPIGPQQFAEAADLLNIRVDSARGFLTNTKRGTAFLYGEEAVNNFLQTNGLTHIIRAHEVPAHGYTFHFGNKCTTVFSSSHYCGNNNEAAVIHVDNEKLRVIRLDTVNNSPACD